MVPVSSSLTSGQVLLIDQTSHGAAARRMVLEQLGLQVTLAQSSEQGLEALTIHPCCLVVCDHQPPDVDAVALIRSLRVRGCETPVVLICGIADALGLHEQNTGACMVIQKGSTEVAQLERAVQRVLRRRPARKPVASQLSSSAARVRSVPS